MLTYYEYSRISKKVTEPELDKLIERVRKATAPRGSKTLLASWLKVSPQVLNDWLSRRFSPGGEITLRLQKWVSAEEEKQQSPDRVEARPERKTQLRNNAYVKPKSGP